MSSDEQVVKNTLNAYRDALVKSDASAIFPLYTPDGVTMAQHFPTQVGHKAIEGWYKQCFDAIKLAVEFKIEEVVVISSDYAFARTSSSGMQTVNATGQSSKEANQELFVIQKVEDEWKIARYCFCTTNPPK